MSDWPAGWISAKELQSRDEREMEAEVSLTNDHGILYLIGDDPRQGEYLHTMEELPAHLENRC